jgi:hypothetical protein
MTSRSRFEILFLFSFRFKKRRSTNYGPLFLQKIHLMNMLQSENMIQLTNMLQFSEANVNVKNKIN